MRSGNGSIDVVLADASTLTLDASASKWTGRAPSALAKRGDLVRVRRIETPVKKKAGSDDKGGDDAAGGETARSEEHTSELQSLMRISYAVFCLKKKSRNNTPQLHTTPERDKKHRRQ